MKKSISKGKLAQLLDFEVSCAWNGVPGAAPNFARKMK